VWWKEKSIDLTTKEYSILEYLMRNPNAVVTRKMIEEHAWNYDFDSMSNLVDVYIRRLRQKNAPELGNLAATLNRMIARLERAFERQKEFTGDASHELRAPLSIIQAEATLALRKERRPREYRKALEVISSEADNMA